MLAMLAMAGLKIIQGGLALDAAQKSADMKRLETMEEWRRLRRKQLTTEGEALAVGAASGVDVQSEGLMSVVADMSAEHDRQATWLKNAGMEEANAIDRAGVSKYVGDLGSAFFSFGSNNNWFKSSST